MSRPTLRNNVSNWGQELKRRHARGDSSRTIAAAFGCDPKTVRNWAETIGIRFANKYKK